MIAGNKKAKLAEEIFGLSTPEDFTGMQCMRPAVCVGEEMFRGACKLGKFCTR